DQWSVQANAGDAFAISLSESGPDTPFQPWLLVYSPTGTNVVNTHGGLWVDGFFTATTTGTYRVIALRFDASDGAGQYILTYVRSPGPFSVPGGDNGGQTTNGGNYSGSLLRGDLDQWSITANAGDPISVGLSEVGTDTPFQPWLLVYAPDGTNVVN